MLGLEMNTYGSITINLASYTTTDILEVTLEKDKI